jgi:perosamine synthetase
MSDKFLSCSGLGYSLTDMISALSQSHSKSPDWFQFTERDTIFTHQGRYAIFLMCQLLHIGPGDEVMVPAYNCGAEIDPYIWAGAKVVFYRVDKRALIDLEDIIGRLTPSTRMIHVSHFYGWPQEIGELGKWCKEKGLHLLEDCALALFSDGPNRTIGRIGDSAIYSFVKSLPVPDGGALVLTKNIRNENKKFRPPRHRNIVLSSLPLLKKSLMHKNTVWQNHGLTRKLLTRSWLKRPVDDNNEIERQMPKSNYFTGEKIGWSISRLSKGILSTTNPKNIVEIRRRNYQYLNSALINVPSIRLLFNELPDGVCPLSFPVLVKDRNRWCKALEDSGILVGGWPSYHRGFDWKEFPEARNLKNNLLALPVHQDLGVQHMEHIAKCVKFIAGGNDNHYGR